MPIKSNASTEEVIGGIKLYSGLTNMSIIAINPSMEDLHDLGINVKSEPNYFVEFTDAEYFKLTFWLKNNDSTVRMEILLNGHPRQNKNKDKFQWMNKSGQSTWSAETPTYDWWKNPESSRKAYSGEEILINFIRAWANVATGDDVYFETISKIVSGDATEVKGLVDLLKDNQVRVLLGVKDNKYQQVYTKYFGRVKPQRDDLFVRALNDEYGTFNADFDPTLIWGSFKPLVSLVQPDAEAVVEEKDWVEGSDKDTDLPF